MAHPSIIELDVDALEPSARRRGPLPRVSPTTVALIRRHGPVQAVVVRRLGAGYEILAGLSTWLAVQRAGQDRLPVKVLEGVDDAEADRILASENDGPLVRAERYRDALKRHGGPGAPHAVRAVAREAGVSRSSVAHALRLLELPDLVKQALASGALSAGHAKALATPSLDPARRMELASRTIEHGWSVRRLEQEIAGDEPAPRTSGHDETERALAAALGVPVMLRDGEGGGIVELRYGNAQGLAALLERLGTTARVDAAPKRRGRSVPRSL